MHQFVEENHVVIRVNLKPLNKTGALPFLWRKSTYNNSAWAVLYINLQKSHRRWGMVSKLMEKTGKPIKAHAIMYKAAVQVVLMCGSKIWLVKNAMMTVLEVFHHRI